MDQILIQKIKQNQCDESFLKLVEKHSGLFYKSVRQYFSVLSQNLDYYDIIDDKTFVFTKAIYSYKENKGTKFSTWLGQHVRWHCLNTITKSKRTSDIKGLVKETKSKKTLDKKIPSEYITFAKTEREKKIFKLRLQGFNYTEIGKKLKITGAWVRMLHLRTLDTIRKKERITE